MHAHTHRHTHTCILTIKLSPVSVIVPNLLAEERESRRGKERGEWRRVEEKGEGEGRKVDRETKGRIGGEGDRCKNIYSNRGETQ